MKKNLQKILALALTGILVMGLAACGSKDPQPATTGGTDTSSQQTTGSDTTTPAAQDNTTAPADTTEEAAVPGVAGFKPFDSNVTLSIPVYDRGDQSLQPVDDNYWTRYLQEKFGDQYNITMNFVPIARNDQMTAYSLLAASGDLPTFLMEYDYWRLTTWVADGYMQPIDLNEFAFIAPDYYGRMERDSMLPYSVVNGETYFVLAERPLGNSNYRHNEFVRMDWLKEVGYDYVPTDYEDENKAMLLIKEAGLCQYPLGGFAITGTGSDQNYGLRGFPMNEEEWAMFSSLGIYSMGWEPAKEFLRRENERYNLGLMDPEYYIKGEEEHRADFINGVNYKYGGYMASTVDWLIAFYENNPDAELAIKPVITTDNANQTAVYRSDNPFGMIIGFSSQASADEIKAAWMYFEWMMQEENLFPFSWGEEGETYNMDGGTPVAVGDYDGEFKMGFNSNKDYWCIVVESRVVGLASIDEVILGNAPQGLPQDFGADLIKKTNEQLDLHAKGYGIIDPLFSEAIELEAEYSAALSGLYLEYRDQLVRVSPEEFSDLYDSFSQNYWNAGFEDIIEARRALYQAGKSSLLPDGARK